MWYNINGIQELPQVIVWCQKIALYETADGCGQGTILGIDHYDYN